jgi:hypothetical protein
VSSLQQRFRAGLLLALILFAQSLAAQPATGALRGQITDQLGAVIVGATITVANAKGAVTTASQLSYHSSLPDSI